MLPDQWLPSVWEEVHALQPRLSQQRKHQTWQGRQQQFWWVNDIDYSYDHDRQHLPVHVVGGEETWQEADPDSGEIVDKHTHHVWLSSAPLNPRNVHERCNFGARQRWWTETRFLIEKRQGYYYEHAFSYNWNALRRYHYLMRLAHLLNALALATKRVKKLCCEMGMQAFLGWVRESCANRWLRPEWLEQLRLQPPQLRLE